MQVGGPCRVVAAVPFVTLSQRRRQPARAGQQGPEFSSPTLEKETQTPYAGRMDVWEQKEREAA